MKANRVLPIIFAATMAASIAAAQGAKPKPTGQMPGASAKIGTPYKLGETGKELQFTLEQAEFATRFMIDNDTIVATPDHRLLVISFAVQNPAKVDRQFNSNSFKFTVVSPDDENFVVAAQIVHPERRTILDMNLKPTQKVRAMAYVMIHGQGPVNKLMIQRGEKTPVLRYDLHDQVKPLANVFAADQGKGSLNQGAGIMKVPFELGPFDLAVDSQEDIPAIGDWKPDEGKKLVVLHMVMTNVSMVKYWSTGEYQYKLFDEDGDEIEPAAILKNSSEENFYTNPEPNSPMKYRLLFYAPVKAKLTKIVVTHLPSGRAVLIPLPVPGDALSRP